MSKKYKENLYRLYQLQVKDKDKAVQVFIENTLAKTQAMFAYTGLPDTIPPVEFERILQTNGTGFVTMVNDKLYMLTGGYSGEVDAYNRPTKYTVANTALKLSKTYDVATDGVLVHNDTNDNSLLPLIGKFAVLYTDAVITLDVGTVLNRITMLISASDDKTKDSAEEFVKKILNGEFSVIGENQFFKGVNFQHAPTANSNNLTQTVEVIQYIKAQMLNELGLNANFNMKRERLNMGEVSLNEDSLLPYVDNMLSCRQQAVQAINDKYGTGIQVMLGSSWKLNHESYERQLKDVTTTGTQTKPVDDAKTGDDKPVDDAKTGDDKPVDDAKTGDDKPVDDDKTGDDKPVDDDKTGDDKPVDDDKTGDDKPTDNDKTGNKD